MDCKNSPAAWEPDWERSTPTSIDLRGESFPTATQPAPGF